MFSIIRFDDYDSFKFAHNIFLPITIIRTGQPRTFGSWHLILFKVPSPIFHQNLPLLLLPLYREGLTCTCRTDHKRITTSSWGLPTVKTSYSFAECDVSGEQKIISCPNWPCKRGFSWCGTKRHCVRNEQICDSNNDCGNWEDEQKKITGTECKITDRGGGKTNKEINRNTAFFGTTGKNALIYLLYFSSI